MLSVEGEWLDQVVFLGTGTSSQVPAMHCITDGSQGRTSCATCADALLPGSPNRRRCTSVVAVGRYPPTSPTRATILIDCGKSFYESAILQFPKYGLREIDAVLLTHAHADAILGLDDLRSWTLGGCLQDYVDVYLTQECMETVQNTFPYLVDSSFVTGGGDVGALRWHIIDAHTPFTAGPAHVPVTPLKVEHGFMGADRRPFECLGFRLDSMSYVSDCHAIPQTTLDKMQGSALLVLDALKMTRHASHYSIPQAITRVLELAEQDRPPTLAIFTDVAHTVEHRTTEAQLQQLVKDLRTYRATLADPPPEWWRAVWNPDANERQGRIATTKPVKPKGDAPLSPYVPAMHFAIDGLSVSLRR